MIISELGKQAVEQVQEAKQAGRWPQALSIGISKDLMTAGLVVVDKQDAVEIILTQSQFDALAMQVLKMMLAWHKEQGEDLGTIEEITGELQ